MQAPSNTLNANSLPAASPAAAAALTTTQPSKSRIRRLDEVTVNRIAAGEIIHRPANAIKELLENALDAGSTAIQVQAKDGGVKLLQIQDNGSGIHKDDLGIVCERFTTSKLRKYEDLESIATFGFRGEALASISHIAHLAIVTRTKESPCAWRASYAQGKLVSAKPGGSPDPQPCAANVGTQITVEDLFYNSAIRRKSFTNLAEEYARILDVVQRYAIHNNHVSFTCRKHNAHAADLQTPSTGSKVDIVRTVFGNQIARELIDFEFESVRWDYKASGLVSNANFNTKKFTLILFINNRLVESRNVKKSIEILYAKYLPKGTHPFVYLSLHIKPENLDVNVHPTKKLVQFLHEDSIIETLCEAIDGRLAGANDSRVYYVQTTLTGGTVATPASGTGSAAASVLSNSSLRPALPGPAGTLAGRGASLVRTADATPDATIKGKVGNGLATIGGSSRGPSASAGLSYIAADAPNQPVSAARPSENRLVRTDNRTRTLDAYITPARPAAASSADSLLQTDGPSRSASLNHWSLLRRLLLASDADDDGDAFADRPPLQRRGEQTRPVQPVTAPMDVDGPPQPRVAAKTATAGNAEMEQLDAAEATSSIAGRDFIDVQLTSVLELRQALLDNEHKGLTELFREHTFVGCIDNYLALVQHHTKLYMVNYQDASRDLFYQITLRGFSNFGTIRLGSPLPISELVLMALDATESWDADSMMAKPDIAASITQLLVDRREMLAEYFSIIVDAAGCLCGVPVLMRGYTPCFDKAAEFLLRMGANVNWDDEKECFRGIAEELSVFFEFEAPLDTSGPPATPAAAAATPSVTSATPAAATHMDSATLEYRRQVQHLLFPALKRHLIASKRMLADAAVRQLADLPELYKVFERC
ncbi:hypothetical protein BC831DRAFT_475824 [Entophlyctis helioformis]|nr:hypothetical protein BC831DRAFT_475824 [Entophlyctis helioformis]